MSQLNNNDYINILNYYNETIPKSSHLLKSKALTIIANKLCKCIKKVSTKKLVPRKGYSNKSREGPEGREIALCTTSVINKKGFKRGSFKCGKNASVKLTKSSKSSKIIKNSIAKLNKTRKNKI